MPKYTPEQIRAIGDTTIPAVAESYETLKSKVTAAKSAAEDTFGNSTLIPHPAAEHFMKLWERYVMVAETTPETLGDMGRAFVDIAGEYEGSDAQAERDLDDLLQGLESGYTEHYKDEE